ncbi:unnamed protein product [Gongylonema pulchrum]|uniref:Wsv419-like protein n=1 Tax=Gongylonema pulchrum TaxID=637853 RepID=A0A183EGL8_9BILA|nr:unnamed protein product [Gongylonema pulchrum]
MEWIHGMVFGLSPEILQHIMDKTEMIELRGALLDSFVRHSLPKKTYLDSKSGSGAATDRVRHFVLLRRLSVFNLILNGGSVMVAKFVRRIFKRCHLGVQDKITGIWQATPPVLFVRNGLSQTAQDLMEFEQQKISECSFTPEHFKLVADFLLNSVVPTYCFNKFCVFKNLAFVHFKFKKLVDDGNWMTDTPSLLCAAAIMRETNMDCASKWLWVVAQMAQFCVDNRLKTPFGKAMNTFLTFESSFLSISF